MPYIPQIPWVLLPSCCSFLSLSYLLQSEEQTNFPINYIHTNKNSPFFYSRLFRFLATFNFLMYRFLFYVLMLCRDSTLILKSLAKDTDLKKIPSECRVSSWILSLDPRSFCTIVLPKQSCQISVVNFWQSVAPSCSFGTVCELILNHAHTVPRLSCISLSSPKQAHWYSQTLPAIPMLWKSVITKKILAKRQL